MTVDSSPSSTEGAIPASVTMADIAAAREDAPVVGITTRGAPVTIDLNRESPHVFWRMLVPEISPAPARSSIPGRWQIASDGVATETQVAYLSLPEARELGRGSR